MKRDGTWDIRLTPALRRMVLGATHGIFHSRGIRTNKAGAVAIAAQLAKAYKVRCPSIVVDVKALRQRGANAMYYFSGEVIVMYGTNHVKSIFHEFYHHLDNVTHGKYHSSDRYKFAWEFAERLYAKIKGTT